MKNKELLKKEDISVFDKIRGFFSKLFNKEQKCIGSDNKLTNKEFDCKQFSKTIETNPSIIESLSNDKLDRLIKYYEKIVNEKKIKIEQLRISR